MRDVSLYAFDGLTVDDFQFNKKPYFDAFGLDTEKSKVIIVDVNGSSFGSIITRDCELTLTPSGLISLAFLQEAEEAINLDDLLTQRLLC